MSRIYTYMYVTNTEILIIGKNLSFWNYLFVEISAESDTSKHLKKQFDLIMHDGA